MKVPTVDAGLDYWRRAYAEYVAAVDRVRIRLEAAGLWKPGHQDRLWSASVSSAIAWIGYG